ncbi:glycosyltransferase family 4 protein [Cohnella thermotolerans]|uniref:glycosyltransferase family 4 protein n=1 Tax=Cohnella thermotolerans TaxID=329858 RepID=UPI000421158C|nr:glycosyltransferase family 4 protein [Cohnella thermotolerans]
MRALLLTNTMSPYRIPVLNKVHADKDIDLTVWYLQERESNRKWNIDRDEIKYNYECLKGFHTYIQRLDFGLHINPGLFWKLVKHSPDIIMTTGYDAPGYWVALLYSKVFRKKFTVWWGSTLESSRVQNTWVNRLRSFFLKQADSFVTYGTEASKCLVYYGVEEKKIVTGYNTVDVRYFYKQYKKKRKSSQDLQTTNHVNFLFIGQLIPRKGLEEVIDAFSEIPYTNWGLKIVGSGPIEELLRNRIAEKKLEQNVTFEGFKQKEELINYLIEADCLVFPSLREVWGLVVNEALATDTFILASKYAGATKDIIIDKENGLVIDPLDQHNLVQSLNWIMSNVSYVKSARKLSFKLWRKLHPFSYGRSVIQCIKSFN